MLKKVLPSIIYEVQSIFIKERDIIDNISLAHELCQEFIPPHRLDVFAAKIDLKKAFDMFNQNALLHRLGLKGFPSRFINKIYACIFEANFSIVLNG